MFAWIFLAVGGMFGLMQPNTAGTTGPPPTTGVITTQNGVDITTQNGSNLTTQ